MTTGIDRDEVLRQRRWAAEQLGLAEGAGPDEARAAFLRLLADADFVPEASWCQAVGLLTGASVPGAAEAAGEADAEEEDNLRGEIEDFAGQFWSLSLGERRQCWQSLYGRSGFAPTLRARLEELRPGLTVGPVPEGVDLDVAALAQEVRSLFVLRPVERASARQALLQRMRACMESREATAQLLTQQLPAVAALEPVLVQTLASWTAQREHLARQRRHARTVAATATPASSSKGGWSGLWIVFVLIGGLARACSSESHKTPKYDLPTYQTPSRNLPQQPWHFDPNDPVFRRNDPLKDIPEDQREKVRQSIIRSLRTRKKLEDLKRRHDNPNNELPGNQEPRNPIPDPEQDDRP